MFPISRSAESPISVPASTPSSSHSAARALDRDQQQHEPLDVALERDHDARDHVIGAAARLDGVGQRQRQRARDAQLDLAAEHLRERGGGVAGGDVRQLPQSVELQFGVARGH